MEQSTYVYVKLTRTVARYLKEIDKDHLIQGAFVSGWIYYIQVKLYNNQLKRLAVYSHISINFEVATVISALEFKRILFDWSMSQ